LLVVPLVRSSNFVYSMAEMDRLLYFNAKARGEAIRQLYILSGTEFFDEKIDLEEFKERKAG